MNRLIFVAAALAIASTSVQANSFTNGDFAANGGPGQINVNTSATGWYVPGGGYTFIYKTGAADTCCTNGQYGNNELWGTNNGGLDAITAPPSGAAQFVAQDGDFQNAPINQDITGLTIGKTYTVGFDYAYAQQFGFTGDTVQDWCVNLGASAAQCTAKLTNPSHGFTGWFHQNFNFTATGAAETLSFLAYGDVPVPPFAVLGGVTFTPDAVPEPATWALMLIGIGGMGAIARRRRSAALAA